jgi:uncharacterized LabA/DUF88 family protein
MSVIKHKEQRVGVFIDTQNIYHSAKNLYHSNNRTEIIKHQTLRPKHYSSTMQLYSL